MPIRLMWDLARAPVVNEFTLSRRKGAITMSWTPKRLATLKLMADGLLDKEIAVAHAVSVFTIKTQIKAIYALLDAKNRAHAVHLAHLKGLL